MGKKIQRNSKNKTIITAVILAVVILFGLWLVGRYRVRQDAVRFHDADQEKQQVFDALVQKIGNPIQEESKDVCHNSEQGPYDNGVLWCYVSSAAYYANPIQESKMKEYLKSILHNTGHTIKVSNFGDIAFTTTKGIDCGFDVYDGSLAISPGHNLSGNARSKQTVVIDCGGRAKAKHYTYIDY